MKIDDLVAKHEEISKAVLATLCEGDNANYAVWARRCWAMLCERQLVRNEIVRWYYATNRAMMGR